MIHGLDTSYLVAAEVEVHPWFCVSYRDSDFCRWFREKHGASVDMIDRDGGVIELAADVHRPEYRQFMVDLMVGVARDYPVDGIHLDYIRSKGRCYCDACRKQFAEQIELVRRLGIHGYCLFAFGHLSDEQLAVLRDDLNSEPAVPYFR